MFQSTEKRVNRLTKLIAGVVFLPVFLGTGSYALTAANASSTTDSAAAMDATVKNMKIMNYYPTNAAWQEEWTNFQPVQQNKDFAGMHAMGVNTVRIIVNTPTFGYPTPQQKYLDELDQTFQEAAANGLKVQLTLFDFFGQDTDFTGSDTWAKAVLAPYKNDPRLGSVDLRNEVDPTNATRMNWTKHELAYSKSLIGNVPITISVTNYPHGTTSPFGDSAQALQALVNAIGDAPIDYYDIHFYGAPENTLTVVSAAKSIADAHGKPLIVGEYGKSTWDGGTGSSTANEAYQNSAVQAMDVATAKLGMAPGALWVWQDFPAGANTAGHANSPLNKESFFGLIRTDGSKKPAYVTAAAFFGANTVQPLAPTTTTTAAPKPTTTTTAAPKPTTTTTAAPKPVVTVPATVPPTTVAPVNSAVNLKNVKLTNLESGLVLDVSGESTADLASVIQYADHGGSNQRWNIQSVANDPGYVTITSMNSGKCLDVPYSNTTAGITEIQYTCHGGANQEWKLLKQTNGSYILQSKSSGLVLDDFHFNHAAGANIVQYPINYGRNQTFTIG